MHAMVLALVLSAANPTPCTQPACGSTHWVPPAPSPAVADTSHATSASLEHAVRQALRRWAGVSDANAEQAARELLPLYQRLRHDQSLAASTRSQLQTRLRFRLAQLAQQIRRHSARQFAQAGKPGAKPKTRPPSRFAPPGGHPVWLAQARPAFQGPPNPPLRLPATQAGRAANPAVPDYGLDLVDLIQRTIAPDSWDVRGGPGSIYYWRPGRALVVRQTTEVHDWLAETLEQLRADP